MAESSIGVMPYIEASQSGLPYIFMAAKKPMVVTRVGGLPKQVSRKFAEIVEPDHEAFAEGILRLGSRIEKGEIMDEAKVLIVDDEPDIVESIKFNLELEGIQCIEAHDGEEALSKARSQNPALIILDIMLPKINGYKIARLLKFDEAYKHIPIIMLTARTQQTDIELGEETGADEYVTKPFDMDMLVALVKKYLGN